MSKTEVAEVENKTAVAAFDYGEDAHGGFEDTTIQDLSIPFVNLLQALSPEVEDQLIEGAAAGMLLNSVTKEFMTQPLIVQPVLKEEVWVEWVPRHKGGGVVARHEPNSDIIKEVLKKNNGSRIPPKDAENKRPPFKMPDGSGNDLVETHYWYCLILDEEGLSQESYCVLAFSSTKIKVQKDWMTSMYTVKGNPPMWAHRAKVSTSKQKSDSGSFFNFSIAPFGDTWREGLINPSTEEGKELLRSAKEFREMIQSGLARPDMDGADSTDTAASPAGGGKPADDDDMPF